MFHIRLLGEQVISDDAGTVRTRSSRSVALVAHLVVHAHAPQTRQRIASLFWPDSVDEQALTNLRRELHHLRGVLGDEPSLVVTPRDLCWQDTPTCRVDVRVLEGERDAALAAAAAGDTAGALVHGAASVDAYRGEFLPGGYDDWLLDVRADLERHCVEMLDLVSGTRARAGDLAGAVADGRRRIGLRPLEEIGYRRLMEWQGELGDRAGAVSTYHHCASVLERELGVEPDAATRASLDHLLTQAGPTLTPTPTERPPPGRPALAARLVGRDAELRALQGVWSDAAAGHPMLALVRGAPGVGKSRLVAEVAELARLRGAVVANAQCFGTSGRLALSAVADWLRIPAVQATMPSLDQVWRLEVERLVPPGKGRAGPGVGTGAMVEGWQRHRFFEGLARALVGTGRPTLLVLDNLQWCDQETRAFLTFTLALRPDTPVMVAATLRAADLDHEPGLEEWIAVMRATGMLREVPVHPLEGPDTARLAEEISDRPLTAADRELLQATTGGFPLYVVEAARGGADPDGGPLPIGDLGGVLSRRLDQVDAEAREVAGLAAAVGRNFTLDLLTEASDLDADSVVRAVDLSLIHI